MLNSNNLKTEQRKYSHVKVAGKIGIKIGE